MKIMNVRVCLSVFSLLGLGLAGETHAAGPVAAQQSVTQIQSSLSEASAGGWRRWGRHCCGYGYGMGYGYGGYGGYGYGYPSFGYAGYGYGGGGYGGGMTYGYPAYSYSMYRPRVYSTYSYAAPYQSTYCCGGGGYSGLYGASNYSYGSQPLYASSGYSTGYAAAPAYGASSYGNPVYTPSYSSPTVISSPSLVYPTSNGYSVPATSAPATSAPYPAPPVEIPQPSAFRAPIAGVPMDTASYGYPTYVAPGVGTSVVNNPVYSPTFAYTGASPAAYTPTGYTYSPSAPTTLTRLSAGIVW